MQTHTRHCERALGYHFNPAASINFTGDAGRWLIRLMSNCVQRQTMVEPGAAAVRMVEEMVVEVRMVVTPVATAAVG